MEIKRLYTATLSEALMRMSVGEVCSAPDGYSPVTVIRTCSNLKSKGYLFKTTRSTGEQLITRLR